MVAMLTSLAGWVAVGLVVFASGELARADDGYVEAHDDESCQDGPNRTYCPPERCSWCANQGRCFFDEKIEMCAVGRGACKDSPACRLYGRCTEAVSAIDGRASCVAGSDAGCKASAMCAAEGRCGKAAAARVVPEEEERDSLASDGPRCLATSTPMCAASAACRKDMRCVARKGRCEAKDQAACSRFAGCREKGRCTFSYGSCEVETNKDCRRSEICKRFGACVADGGSGHFPAVCVAQGCEGLEVCERYGACTPHWNGCGTDNPYEPECPRERWVPVQVASVEASSTMPGAGGYRFEASQVHDGELTTSWQPAKSKANGVGQRLVVTLSRPAVIVALEIANGFQRIDKLGDQFTLNSRVRHLYMELDQDTRHLFELDTERRGFAEVFVTPSFEPVAELTLEIAGVAPGTRWNDPAISEIKIFACADEGGR